MCASSWLITEISILKVCLAVMTCFLWFPYFHVGKFWHSIVCLQHVSKTSSFTFTVLSFNSVKPVQFRKVKI